MSESGSVVSGSRQGSNSATTATGSTICKYFLNGACRFGESCFYSHDTSQRTTRTTDNSSVPICKYFLSGQCIYGNKCFYRHKRPDTTSSTSTTNTQDIVKRMLNKPKLNTESFTTETESSEATGSSIKYTSPDSYFEALTGKKMKDNIDLEEINMFDETYGEYLRLRASASAACASVSDLLPLCPYFERQIECPFGDEACELVHGLKCEYCQMPCLHPSDPEQRQTHQVECMKLMEKEMEEAFAIQRSKDKQCGVCMEVVWDKEPASNRRFGILENCGHIYCLDCIRKWRASKSYENKIVKACPECRVKSDYVTPSMYWFEDDDSKKKIIEEYKNKLSKTQCKYFKRGDGTCPFGNKCFYLHQYKDGSLATDLPDPTRRRRLNRYGELEPYSNLISVGIRFHDYDFDFHVFSDDDDDEDIDPESAAVLINLLRQEVMNMSNRTDNFFDDDDYESDDSWYP